MNQSRNTADPHIKPMWGFSLTDSINPAEIKLGCFGVGGGGVGGGDMAVASALDAADMATGQGAFGPGYAAAIGMADTEAGAMDPFGGRGGDVASSGWAGGQSGGRAGPGYSDVASSGWMGGRGDAAQTAPLYSATLPDSMYFQGNVGQKGQALMMLNDELAQQYAPKVINTGFALGKLDPAVPPYASHMAAFHMGLPTVTAVPQFQGMLPGGDSSLPLAVGLPVSTPTRTSSWEGPTTARGGARSIYGFAPWGPQRASLLGPGQIKGRKDGGLVEKPRPGGIMSLGHDVLKKPGVRMRKL